MRVRGEGEGEGEGPGPGRGRGFWPSRSTSSSTLSVSFFLKSLARHVWSRPFLSTLQRFHTAIAACRCLTATLFSLMTRGDVMPL